MPIMIDLWPLQDYPGEELLIVYDHDFLYGENFYICVTEEAKELILNVRTASSYSFWLIRDHLFLKICIF